MDKHRIRIKVEGSISFLVPLKSEEANLVGFIPVLNANKMGSNSIFPASEDTLQPIMCEIWAIHVCGPHQSLSQASTACGNQTKPFHVGLLVA
jgi:hypothetical protein